MNGKRVIVAAVVVMLFASSSLQAQAPREGIVVHGHWVLEVRNPDGSVADRREFENALVQGASLMTDLLLRRRSMGNWAIYLGTQDSYQQPDASDPTSPFLSTETLSEGLTQRERTPGVRRCRTASCSQPMSPRPRRARSGGSTPCTATVIRLWLPPVARDTRSRPSAGASSRDQDQLRSRCRSSSRKGKLFR